MLSSNSAGQTPVTTSSDRPIDEPSDSRPWRQAAAVKCRPQYGSATTA